MSWLLAVVKESDATSCLREGGFIFTPIDCFDISRPKFLREFYGCPLNSWFHFSKIFRIDARWNLPIWPRFCKMKPPSPPPPPVRFKTMVYILSCLQRNWFQLWQFKSNDKRKKEIRKTGKDLIYFILLFKYWFVRIFHSFPLPFPFPPPPPRFSHSDKLFEYSEAVIFLSERIQNSTDSVWMHDLILIDLPSIYTLIVQQRLRFSPSLFLFLNLFEIHQQEITWWLHGYQ